MSIWKGKCRECGAIYYRWALDALYKRICPQCGRSSEKTRKAILMRETATSSSYQTTAGNSVIAACGYLFANCHLHPDTLIFHHVIPRQIGKSLCVPLAVNAQSTLQARILRVGSTWVLGMGM